MTRAHDRQKTLPQRRCRRGQTDESRSLLIHKLCVETRDERAAWCIVERLGAAGADSVHAT